MKIKSILSLVLAGCILLAGCQANEPEKTISSESTVNGNYDLAVDFTKLRRGVNLSALEDPQKYSKFLFDDDTYTNIAEKGFDHVRFPVDFRNYAKKDGTLNDRKMKDVDSVIKAANEAGLVVFLDFHGWADLNTIKGDDILFMKIWKGIAERYKDYKHNDMLIFELINEPHITEGGNLDMTSLSIIQCLTANTIREISPNRTICFATTEWNSPWTLKTYKTSPMMNYENVIVAVHTYATLEFTHQNMAWMNNLGVIVKLDDNILTELKKQLKDIVDFKKETGVPVILNEFGFNTEPDTIPYEDQARYVQTVVDILGEQDIPCTWWPYLSGEFAIYKKTSMFGKYQWNDTVVDILVAE